MTREIGDTGFSTFACANSLPAYAFAFANCLDRRQETGFIEILLNIS